MTISFKKSFGTTCIKVLVTQLNTSIEYAEVTGVQVLTNL